MFYKSLDLLNKSIRSRLSQAGLSQNRLAELIEVPHGSLSEWLSGKVAIRLERLDFIARSLKCTPWQLLMPDGETIVPGSEHKMAVDELQNRIWRLEEDIKSANRRFNQLIGADKPLPQSLPGVAPIRRDIFEALSEVINQDNLGAILGFVRDFSSEMVSASESHKKPKKPHHGGP